MIRPRGEVIRRAHARAEDGPLGCTCKKEERKTGFLQAHSWSLSFLPTLNKELYL